MSEGLGNWGSPEAVPVLTSALSDPEALVRGHAAWALGRVGSAEAKEALVSRSSVESDKSVRSELAAAFSPRPSRAKSCGSFGAVRRVTTARFSFAGFIPGTGSPSRGNLPTLTGSCWPR